MPGLTERSAVDLAASISRRELTATQVLEAHIELLERDRGRLNAIVADRFDLAREQARSIDQRIASLAMRGASIEPLPLLGVPFTVKESIAVDGMPSTAGVLARRDHRPTRTATVVRRLINAGAIPVGVTNTSELTLWIESDNPVYGRTNNPYDPTRTSGGSSGGEGATVGSGGVPFGIGADVGGSIRVPALFCGVFGHKGSSGLVPTTGMWPNSTGDAGKLMAVGPLARRAEDLMPLLRVISGADGLDPLAEDIELGDPGDVSVDGLAVTIVENSTFRPISRELRDARERAVRALVSAGAHVRSVDLTAWRQAVLPFLAALQNTGNGSASATALLVEAGDTGSGVRELLFGRSHTLPTKLTVLAESLPARIGGRTKLLSRAQELADQLTEAIGDGILLHPAHPTVAPKHRRTYGRPWLTTPAAVFNLAGVPVTEVPMGLTASGLPVGVQVAAPHGEDHLSIAIALELESVFGGWVPPTGSTGP
jgi:fatty acid amide hydrolase 2